MEERTKAQLLEEMHNKLGMHIWAIMLLFEEYNLPMTKFTLVSRNPEIKDHVLVFSNERAENLQTVADYILHPETAKATYRQEHRTDL